MARVVSFLSVLAVLGVLFVLFSCSFLPSASESTNSLPTGENTSSSNTNGGLTVKVVYVSTTGNDTNDGLSPSKPVRTLVKAVEVANTIDMASNVLIKVSSGVYTNGDGLSNTNVGFVIDRPNVIISGGWNSDFSSVVGKSELDGNNNLYHMVMITNVTNVKLENLVIRSGNANDVTFPNNSGGGIYVSNVSYLAIESNVVISNNYADSFGGGVYLYGSANNTISGSVW